MATTHTRFIERSGSENILAELGVLYAPNLTPGGELATWSDGEIMRAIREGVDNEGRALWIMPSDHRHLSDADVTAKELLRELPGLQEATGRWLDQYRRGRFEVELNTAALADSVTHFSQSMRRVTVALILIGLLIGSAIASSLLRELQATQWAFLPIMAMGSLSSRRW